MIAVSVASTRSVSKNASALLGRELHELLAGSLADALGPEVAAQLVERAGTADAPNLRPLTVTCSVGVALNEHELDTPEMILKRADVALYRAKREGRNRVVFDAA